MKHENTQFDYCIVGAGPSGLTLAYNLLKFNKKVLLIERDSRVGGLCKSFNYNNHIFDIGPKRFYTKDKSTTYFIKKISNDNLIDIYRSSKVFFDNKYLSWPLSFKDAFKMPITISIKVLLDMLKKNNSNNLSSFESYIKYKYGNTLYNIFFKPYTEKFSHFDPKLLDADWALYSINRTLIDERYKSEAFLEMLRNMLLYSNCKTLFLYPASGGFGSFFENLFEKCKNNSQFEHLFCDKIKYLSSRNNVFHATTLNEKTITFKNLIWSGNINDLFKLTLNSAPHFPFINTVLYNFICKKDYLNIKNAQWIYLGNKNTSVSRITCMAEFAKYTCHKNYYNFICELTDSQNHPNFFSSPEKYISQIIEELKSIQFIKKNFIAEDIKIERVVDTYPIYYKSYNKDLENYKTKLKQVSNKIFLLGRSGSFWYNNTDHSIKMALDLATHLIKSPEKEFTYDRSF